MTIRRFAAAAPALALLAGPAGAGEAWDEIRPMLYGERAVAEAPAEVLTLNAPYRAIDDREVPIEAEVRLPEGEGIAAVSLIIDENPMPVSAVFEMAEGSARGDFTVLVNMRLNGPSPVRAVVETTGGRLLMAEAMVKTSGLGACAAPPVTDPEAALATLGEMSFAPVETALAPGGIAGTLAALEAGEDGLRGRLEISHPSHSGLQMNQITLLHIPAHYVQTVEVWEGEAPAFAMTGSISLSEDPEIEFTWRPNLGPLRVRVTDTEGDVYERSFAAGAEG